MHDNKNTKLLTAVTNVHLEDIEPLDNTFQSRHFDAMRSSLKHQAAKDSSQLVKDLATELTMLAEDSSLDPRKRHLKPIVIFETGNNKHIIVSGWHRYTAYRYYNKNHTKNNKQKKVIPVRFFKGTKDQAMLFSTGEDIKPTVPKNNEQKRNAAWCLIHTENEAAFMLSDRALGRQTGVGRGTINKMRKVYRDLKQTEEPPIDNWRFQLIKINSNTQLPEEDQMQAKIDHSASQILSKYLHDTCRGDKSMFLEILKETTKRAGIQDETIDLLLDPDPLF